MNRLLIYTLAMACLLVGTAGANAQVVYDNGGGPTSNLFFRTSVTFPIADDFVLSAGSTTFSRITWWGAYFGSTPVADQMAFSLGLDDSGVPALGGTGTFVPFNSVARTDTGLTVPGLGRPIFQFDGEIDPVTLNAGQTYWLSLSSIGSPDLLWATSDITTGNVHAFFFRDSTPDEWRSTSTETDLAFNLSVPEPTSLALLGLGGLFALRRRKKFQS